MHNANLLKPSTQAKETRFILCTWNSNIRQAMIVIQVQTLLLFRVLGNRKFKEGLSPKRMKMLTWLVEKSISGVWQALVEAWGHQCGLCFRQCVGAPFSHTDSESWALRALLKLRRKLYFWNKPHVHVLLQQQDHRPASHVLLQMGAWADRSPYSLKLGSKRPVGLESR